MATSNESVAATVGRWRTRGWTTIVLESNADREWLATQRGVDVEGCGETAALAAASYCHHLRERMSKAGNPPPRVRYRCCACGLSFEPRVPGAAACPRCQAVGGHEELAAGPPGGALDGR